MNFPKLTQVGWQSFMGCLINLDVKKKCKIVSWRYGRLKKNMRVLKVIGKVSNTDNLDTFHTARLALTT